MHLNLWEHMVIDYWGKIKRSLGENIKRGEFSVSVLFKAKNFL